MTKTLRVRFWFIRVSQGYNKDFHCLLHKTPKLFFHHHFTLTSGRSQFHFPPLFPPQLPSVSHFFKTNNNISDCYYHWDQVSNRNKQWEERFILVQGFRGFRPWLSQLQNAGKTSWQETHVKEEAIKMARKKRARKQGHRRRCFQRPPNIVWLPREGHQLGA